VGALAWVSWAAPGRAQLVDEGYSLDLVEIPVLGSGRVVSMGGAFVALAEGIDGVPFNPAAYAVRSPREHSFFEWELSPSFSFGTSKNDVFNSGRGGLNVSGQLSLELGLRLQFGPVGVGGYTHLESYNATIDGRSVSVIATRSHLGAGLALFNGQLVVGVGVRALQATLAAGNDVGETYELDLFSFVGFGLEAGALYMPADRQYRLGVAVAAPVHSLVNPETSSMVGMQPQVPRPRGFQNPLELRLGGAYQFGPRRLNARTFENKDVEGPIMRDLRQRWCERELEQVRRELAAAGRPEPERGLSCPRLRVHARDPEFRAAEQERRDREEDAAEERIERLEDEFAAHLRALADQAPREFYLLSASVTFYGRAEPDSIGLDAFFDQEHRPRRQTASFSFRLGAEAEPWPNRLKTRVGMYLEPARSQTLTPRLHGTFGVDLRLFRWDLFGVMDPSDFRVSFTFDGARDYVMYSVGAGMWY
jgi:hypothetical protein